MNEELPNEFDIIIVGTGLAESILSGALSRIGKKVLHLDHSQQYGGSWSSFNLNGFENILQKKDSLVTPQEVLNNCLFKLQEDEEFTAINEIRQTLEQGSFQCFIKNKTSEEIIDENDKAESKNIDNAAAAQCEKVDNARNGEAEEKLNDETADDFKDDAKDNKNVTNHNDDNENTTKDEDAMSPETESNAELSVEKFYQLSRHFNLDLSPKLMFSRGKLVELLIQSNVCRYLEFRNVSQTLTLLENNGEEELAPVPCSRSDVFSSKFVSVIEKRILMKVLTMCANYEKHPEEYKDFEDKSFVEFLASKKLSKKLQHFMIHSISMVDETCSTMDGLKCTQKFLKSLGRYGNSAFLWPMYGVGELPQAFCRLSAVFGGTFCLQRSIAGIIKNKSNNECVGIIDSTGQRLDCKHLVIDECYVPNSQRNDFKFHVARAVYITNKTMKETETEKVSLITVPPRDYRPACKLMELGPSCCVCPKNYYVVHAMCKMTAGNTDAQSMFKETEKLLFASDETASAKPTILWSAYLLLSSGGAAVEDLPTGVHVTNGPTDDVGFDETITEVESLFNLICPDEEFLPRAPNPEEIIFQDDEGYNTEQNDADSLVQDGGPGDYEEEQSDSSNGSESNAQHDATTNSLQPQQSTSENN